MEKIIVVPSFCPIKMPYNNATINVDVINTMKLTPKESKYPGNTKPGPVLVSTQTQMRLIAAANI